MNNQYFINKDKLRLCYTSTPETFEQLKNTTSMQDYGFRLRALPTDTPNIMLALDVVGVETGDWERLCTLQIGNTFTEAEEANYVWVEVENKVLYPTDDYHNSLYYLDSIMTSLGLKFHNFTALDIAIDTNKKNLLQRIKKAIKKFVPIVLDKAYTDKEEVISRLFLIQQISRSKVYAESLYIDNAEKTTGLRVYDKTKELKVSQKEYISEQHGDNGTFWRTEVRLKNRAIKSFLEANNMTSEELYAKLVVFDDREVLLDMFCFYSYRLLHFRDEDNNYKTIFDLAR